MWRSQAKRIVALLLAVAAFGAMRRAADPSGPFTLDDRFAFDRTTLPLASSPDAAPRLVRPTHPDVSHLVAFVASMGAGAALNDLDGNGRADDVCYVDTVTDRVLVAPAPGTGDRYPVFALDHTDGGTVSGLFDRERMVPAGCLPVDANEDGTIDLITFYLGRPPILFSHNGSSREAALSAASFHPTPVTNGNESWSSGSATVADLDGDGHLELIAVNWLANGGAAYDPGATTPVEMPDSMSSAFNGGGIHIFQIVPNAQPSGLPTFVSVKDAVPDAAAHGWGLAVGAADLDGDLLPELYVGNDFGPDRLLWNRSTPGQIRFEVLEGASGFAVPKSKVLGHDSFKGMGVDFGDLNDDGIPDIYVSNITEPLAVLESQLVFLSTGDRTAMAKGRAPYVEAGEGLGLAHTGWAWDAKLEDFDNDGTLEAVQTTGFLKGTTSRWPEMQEMVITNDRLSHSPNAWPVLGPGDDIARQQPQPFLRADGRSLRERRGADRVRRGTRQPRARVRRRRCGRTRGHGGREPGRSVHVLPQPRDPHRRLPRTTPAPPARTRRIHDGARRTLAARSAGAAGDWRSDHRDAARRLTSDSTGGRRQRPRGQTQPGIARRTRRDDRPRAGVDQMARSGRQPARRHPHFHTGMAHGSTGLGKNSVATVPSSKFQVQNESS